MASVLQTTRYVPRSRERLAVHTCVLTNNATPAFMRDDPPLCLDIGIGTLPSRHFLAFSSIFTHMDDA